MNSILGVFVFIFGLCVGSFLNAVIYRIEQKKGLGGRSFCPHCKRKLSWKDLFPVFSFLYLRGKCRYCKQKISAQYPILEVSTALIFLLIFQFQASNIKFQGIVDLIFILHAASVLIIIFVYDFKHYLIPDKVLLPAILIAIIYRITESLVYGGASLFLNYFLAALIASGFFLAIFIFSAGKWMGFGDVKLAVLMGLLLGFKKVLVALFLAFLFGAIIGVITILLKKKTFKSEIPFGPFLIIGTFLALFWGNQIINWYLNVYKI